MVNSRPLELFLKYVMKIKIALFQKPLDNIPLFKIITNKWTLLTQGQKDTDLVSLKIFHLTMSWKIWYDWIQEGGSNAIWYDKF